MKNTAIIFFLIATLVQAQTEKIIYVPGSTMKISQLVGDYDRERQSPTLNRTDSRYHLWGTDLGVPFRHHGRRLCGGEEACTKSAHGRRE